MCLMDVLKCDLVEVNEAKFQGVDRPCEIIFSIQEIQKSCLAVVAEIMFEVGEWP
jgi:hypothetical protein